MLFYLEREKEHRNSLALSLVAREQKKKTKFSDGGRQEDFAIISLFASQSLSCLAAGDTSKKSLWE